MVTCFGAAACLSSVSQGQKHSHAVQVNHTITMRHSCTLAGTCPWPIQHSSHRVNTAAKHWQQRVYNAYELLDRLRQTHKLLPPSGVHHVMLQASLYRNITTHMRMTLTCDCGHEAWHGIAVHMPLQQALAMMHMAQLLL